MLRVQPGPGIRESLLAHDDSRSRFTNREFRLGAFATVLNERGSVLLGLRWDADFWGQPAAAWSRTRHRGTLSCVRFTKRQGSWRMSNGWRVSIAGRSKTS